MRRADELYAAQAFDAARRAHRDGAHLMLADELAHSLAGRLRMRARRVR